MFPAEVFSTEPTMSRMAKATLAAAATFCSVTIFTVHYMQRQEHETMYQGVLRDDARRLEKHRQREEALEESLRKRELYERVQAVSKSAPALSSPLAEEVKR